MTTSQVFDSFLPVYDSLPPSWEKAREALVEDLRQMSEIINAREIGFHILDEVLSGKEFFPTSTTDYSQLGTNQVFRQGFRKTIDFGALPNTSTKSVPHGISFDSNFTLTQMYASATDPVGFTAFTLPGATSSVNMDATNVNVTTTSNLSNYTNVLW